MKIFVNVRTCTVKSQCLDISFVVVWCIIFNALRRNNSTKLDVAEVKLAALFDNNRTDTVPIFNCTSGIVSLVDFKGDFQVNL